MQNRRLLLLLRALALCCLLGQQRSFACSVAGSTHIMPHGCGWTFVVIDAIHIDAVHLLCRVVIAGSTRATATTAFLAYWLTLASVMYPSWCCLICRHVRARSKVVACRARGSLPYVVRAQHGSSSRLGIAILFLLGLAVPTLGELAAPGLLGDVVKQPLTFRG
jgi:hypothetical protein